MTQATSAQDPQPQPSEARPDVEIRRSARRRESVAAYREGDRVVILMPAKFSPAEEQQWIDTMVARLEAQEQRRRPSDDELLERALQLNARYLDDVVEPASVRWVANQNARWGSCTVEDASIRLSDRLKGMPTWVIDYVIVHELAHLRVATHGEEFWSLVDRYPRTERARGFLEGVAATAGLEWSQDV